MGGGGGKKRQEGEGSSYTENKPYSSEAGGKRKCRWGIGGMIGNEMRGRGGEEETRSSPLSPSCPPAPTYLPLLSIP